MLRYAPDHPFFNPAVDFNPFAGMPGQQTVASGNSYGMGMGGMNGMGGVTVGSGGCDTYRFFRRNNDMPTERPPRVGSGSFLSRLNPNNGIYGDYLSRLTTTGRLGQPQASLPYGPAGGT